MAFADAMESLAGALIALGAGVLLIAWITRPRGSK